MHTHVFMAATAFILFVELKHMYTHTDTLNTQIYGFHTVHICMSHLVSIQIPDASECQNFNRQP